jgi:hypothetical protein
MHRRRVPPIRVPKEFTDRFLGDDHKSELTFQIHFREERAHYREIRRCEMRPLGNERNFFCLARASYQQGRQLYHRHHHHYHQQHQPPRHESERSRDAVLSANEIDIDPVSYGSLSGAKRGDPVARGDEQIDIDWQFVVVDGRTVDCAILALTSLSLLAPRAGETTAGVRPTDRPTDRRVI